MREVVPIRKRVTKGELVRRFYESEGKMSPELGTKIQEGADDVRLNIPYVINNIESVKTEKQSFDGHRVELLDAKGDVGSVMLWSRPVTSPQSKLGAFVTLLGSNTDKWLHKWIIFKGWEPNNRHIELSEAPPVKSTRATTGKGILKAAKEARGDK